MNLFKKQTRAEELTEVSDGLTASLINREYELFITLF